MPDFCPQNVRNLNLDAIEMWLATDDGNLAWFRDKYKRPEPDKIMNEEIHTMLAFGMMLLIPDSILNATPPDEQNELYKERLNQCRQNAMEPVKSIANRLGMIETLDCWNAPSGSNPEFADNRRYLYLLGEYWDLLRGIVITFDKALIWHSPHPLSRIIIGLRKRIDVCLERLKDTHALGTFDENVHFFLDALMEGDNIHVTAVPEYTCRLLGECESFLEDARLEIGHRDYSLTVAEHSFLEIAKISALQYEGDILQQHENLKVAWPGIMQKGKEIRKSQINAHKMEGAKEVEKTSDIVSENGKQKIVTNAIPPEERIRPTAYGDAVSSTGTHTEEEQLGQDTKGTEKTIQRFEVYDEDSEQSLVFDTKGTISWGPVDYFEGKAFDDRDMPEKKNTSTLYRHNNGHWTLITERFHWEFGSLGKPDAKRLDDRMAADWLVRHNFNPPTDVAHLVANSFFQSGPAVSKLDGAGANGYGKINSKNVLGKTDIESPAPPKPRLLIDTKTNIAVLDGKKYQLTSEQAYFVNGLIKADGLWRSSTEMDITKPDRLKKKLPEPIGAMIESQTGKGYRVPREKLWDN